MDVIERKLAARVLAGTLTPPTAANYARVFKLLNGGRKPLRLNFLHDKEAVLGILDRFSLNSQESYLAAVVSCLKLLGPRGAKLLGIYERLHADAQAARPDPSYKSARVAAGWPEAHEIEAVGKKLQNRYARRRR